MSNTEAKANNKDNIEADKVFYRCQKAAENGDVEAQYKLALSYKNGEGTEKDLEKAFYWYQKSAGSENKFAQYNLGNCYQYGLGVEKDEVKAFEWYEKSAKQGYSDAQNC